MKWKVSFNILKFNVLHVDDSATTQTSVQMTTSVKLNNGIIIQKDLNNLTKRRIIWIKEEVETITESLLVNKVLKSATTVKWQAIYPKIANNRCNIEKEVKKSAIIVKRKVIKRKIVQVRIIKEEILEAEVEVKKEKKDKKKKWLAQQ